MQASNGMWFFMIRILFFSSTVILLAYGMLYKNYHIFSVLKNDFHLPIEYRDLSIVHADDKSPIDGPVYAYVFKSKNSKFSDILQNCEKYGLKAVKFTKDLSNYAFEETFRRYMVYEENSCQVSERRIIDGLNMEIYVQSSYMILTKY